MSAGTEVFLTHDLLEFDVAQIFVRALYHGGFVTPVHSTPTKRGPRTDVSEYYRSIKGPDITFRTLQDEVIRITVHQEFGVRMLFGTCRYI